MDNIKIISEAILFVVGFLFIFLSYYFKQIGLIIPGIIMIIVAIFIYFNKEEEIEQIKGGKK